MRNLILSAFPRNMRLPDPFTPNLKVDLLPEINQSPKFVPEPQNLLPPELRYAIIPTARMDFIKHSLFRSGISMASARSPSAITNCPSYPYSASATCHMLSMPYS